MDLEEISGFKMQSWEVCVLGFRSFREDSEGTYILQGQLFFPTAELTVLNSIGYKTGVWTVWKKKHADLHTDNIKNQDLSIFTICIIFTFFPVHDYYTVCIYKDPSWQVCIPILKLYNLCFNCKLSNLSNL